MKKKTSTKTIIYFLIVLLALPTASAGVDNVQFPELPSAWETGENLRFSMSSEGSALETVILQSRDPEEPGFTDRRTKTCTNYRECNWNLQHSEEESRTYEYRFRVGSQDGYRNSRRQQVTYYNNLDYSVEWTNEPPETSSQGSNIGMSATAHDSAGRFNTEGILRLQYRDSDGNWQTFDSRRCSNSDTRQTCSNSGETVLDSEKLDGDTARFRGKIFFRGGVSTRTSIKTVSLPGESGSIDSVNINNLPSEAEDGSSFEITAEAQGENLQNIYIQRKSPGDSGWTDWRSRDCGGNSDCEFTRTYTVSGTDQMEFRVYAEATGDSDATSGQTVDFIPQDNDRIDSVTLDSLPDEYDAGNSLEVTGDASGNNLDELILRTRESGQSWTQETSQSCGNSNSCEFDYSFDKEGSGTLEFRLRARAGDLTRDSGSIEVVDFYTQRENQINSVSLDNLDSTHPTGEDLEITGDASGQNLERIILQKRDPNSDWENVETQSCSGSNCDFSYNYQQNDEEEVDFRLKAEAGGDSRNSNTDTVQFQDDAEDNIDSVSIDSLPSNHPTDTNLEVSGEAQGNSLDQIIIQQKNSNNANWNNFRSRDCNNNAQCSINRDFSTSRDGEKDFRIKVEADGDTEYSNKETVDFQEGEQNSVDSVSINDLPEEFETSTDLEISGEASGESLDSIIIQQRRPGNSWNDYRTRSCNGNSNCQINRDFSTSQTGDREFRIKAEADGESGTSNTETVSFNTPEPEDRIDTVSIDNLPSRHPVDSSIQIRGDSSGRNLQTLIIQRRTGGSWNDYRSKDCGSSDTCIISRGFTAGSTGDQSFRVKIQTDENTAYSSTQTVNFYTPRSISSVSINQIADRKQVGTSFQINVSASGQNLESLEIQRRPSGENWQTVNSDSCSGSSCTLSQQTSENSPGTYEFRARADAGEITRYSGIQVLDVYRQQQEEENEPQNRELSVSIENIPSRKITGTSVRLSASGAGENLDTFNLQVKDSPNGAWNSINSRNCGGTTQCSYSQLYTSEETGTRFFRAILSNGTNSITSRQISTEYYIPQNIDSVRIEELPDRQFTGTNLEITGYSSGSSLDQLALEKRSSTRSWTTLRTQDCTGSSDSCSITHEYSQENPGDTEFRVQSLAGDRRSYSGIQVVKLIRPGINDLVDTVDVSSPASGLVNQDVVIEGSASGRELESISLEYRESNSWTLLSQRSCTSSDCTIEANYSRAGSGTTDFRTRVTASGQSKVSGVDQTVFYPENGITNVEISDLPAEYPVNQQLRVSGSADGQNLENLYLQSRKSGEEWNSFASKECNGSSCSIESYFREENTVTRNFRVKAVSSTGNATSTLEETRFREVTGEQRVFSVNLGSLPNEYRTDEELEISASATGNRLENLEIQQRRSSGNWERVQRRSCSGSSCSIETDYETSEPVSVEFRAVGRAGDDRRNSGNIEVVEFRDSTSNDGSNTGVDVKVEDRDGRDLEDARVRILNERTRYTDDDGEASFDLDPGNYEVRVSKSGYETEERDIEIEQDERLRERFELEEMYDNPEGFTFSLNYPESVCEGENFDVDVRIRNFEATDSFRISGSGLGSDTESKTRTVNRGERRSVRLRFQDIEGTGNRQFRVRVENSETRTRSRTVEVENCIDREESSISLPTGLSARLDSREVIAGETVRISGDVQGIKNSVDVTASTSGFSKTVSSTRNGGYSIFYTPSSPGEKAIQVSSKGLSTERTLKVLPRSRVSSLEAPKTVVEGDEFEICAQVDSDTDPEVLLFRDGSRIDSKTGSGRICFNTEAKGPGKKSNYWVRAATEGETGSASKQVNVIEADNSYESFPGQISMYRTEPGQAKIEIYNKENSVNSYRISVEGVEQRIFSVTDRQVVLTQGQRKTVFIYFSPGKTGTYTPEIKVSREGEEVFSREITLDASGTQGRRSKGLSSLLPWR